MHRLLTLLAITLFCGIASARVCVYQHANFQGASLCWDTWDRGANDLDRTGMNDQISSIEMTQGEVVEVCKDAAFRGECRTYYSSVYNLDAGFNDSISSLSISNAGRGPQPPPPGRPGPRPGPGPRPQPPRGGDQICFYEDANFRGARFCMNQWDRSIANLDRTGFNDRISSIQIPYGMTVTVYEDAGFSGARRDFSNSISNLDGFFNDRISSIVIQRYR